MIDALALFHGPNAGYALDLYDAYRRDPQSVDPQTRALFDLLPPSVVATIAATAAPSAPALSEAAAPLAPDRLTLISKVADLARALRARGHLAARLDPLDSPPPGDRSLELESYGLQPQDLAALPAGVVGGPAAEGAQNALDAVERLREIYQGTTGYDYSHVHDSDERAWLLDAVESRRYHTPLSPNEKRALLDRLTHVEAFERFLHTAYQGQRRFSIEGTDMLVPMLDTVIGAAAGSNAREIVMGMAHRGRLNVLAHILEKPYAQIFAEFRDLTATAAPSEGIDRGRSDDVKYHLGATGERRGNEVTVKLTLASNPSHLEYIDPVIEGMTRAAQDRRDQPGAPEQDDNAAVPILIHGDAAFPGEGIVAETLNLSRLEGYRTGGTVHIILNNQIGFTTEAHEARSTLYASDLAKGFEIPIIHVNADDPAACIAAARLAYAYRERFCKDVLIDLVGYRRWGHNESDEPAYTQPLMYETIRKHPTVRALWAEQLDREGIVSLDESKAMLDAVLGELREINNTLAAPGTAGSAPKERVARLANPGPVTTAVPADLLRSYNEALLQWPKDFTPHPRLVRKLERRRAALQSDGEIDWAHGETLAFASILADGTPIRMSGQDSERGTFSQRDLVLHDVHTGQTYTPLQALPQAQASFAVYNSPLSEAGVLGFEYGYSTHAPETLVLWEAQYGDFGNAAQVIIDQFIVSARIKWRQYSSLVLLLPHGYEGGGPEHSSARLERFLQLAAQDNIRVANLSTAAQYFHLLRRQAALLKTDPRPLVIMTPKSLLRHPRAASRLDDLAQGTFNPVLDDPAAAQRRDDVSRLVFCSGKVYVDLIEDKARADTPEVAIARVEELYPFPAQQIADILAAYPRLSEVVWLQEEPQNMGAWSFIAPRLYPLVQERNLSLRYIGRPERASPAVASARLHLVEQSKIVSDAFAGVRALQRT